MVQAPEILKIEFLFWKVSDDVLEASWLDFAAWCKVLG